MENNEVFILPRNLCQAKLGEPEPKSFPQLPARMEILESASHFYRAIKRRGLDLREYGRDRPLLAKLAESLSCPDLNLQAYLDNHPEISAEIFLQKFLALAEPFARMFEEIWQYLAEHIAPVANETISVRFGFDPARSTSVDLEAFRRYVETTRTVLATVQLTTWPHSALGKLFELGRVFVRLETDPIVADRLASQPSSYYRPGKPYPLGNLPAGSPPLVQRIHQLFQRVIDSCAQAHNEKNARRVPELDQPDANDEPRAALRDAASLLTDLLPSWKIIFAGADRISKEEVAEADNFYAREIERLLGKAAGQAEVPLLEALDILDLPFWRDRWHTYEIWASVLTLQTLSEYRPRLRIENGRVPLDGYSTEIVADLTGAVDSSGCVALQALTSFGGRDIRPDLRVCRTDTVKAENTMAIVEFKQREAMTCGHVEEVAAKYSAGSPNAGGIILVNYDEPAITPKLPGDCILLQGIEPRARERIAEFERTLLGMLALAGFPPERRSRVLLLDVSGSMGDGYASSHVQAALRSLVQNRSLKVYRFNDGLVAGGDLQTLQSSSLRGQGGTELGLALSQLEKLLGSIDRLLLISDGGHDHPPRLECIAEMRECSPDEIPEFSAWLLGS
jgi:hypothetical protein